MGAASQVRVKRRKVFYIPGYDPFPPRRYRELYRTEGAAQAAISGYDLGLSARLEGDGFGWQVETTIAGQHTTTEIEVLVWSDIVRQSRPQSILATYASMIKTAWVYLSTGTLGRLMRLRKGPVIAALFPVVALILQAFAGLALGWAMYRIVMRMGQEVSAGSSETMITGGGVALGAVTALLVLRWFRDNDGRFFAYYLMHDYAYSACLRGAYPAPLLARLKMFRIKVAEALSTDVDEVLVVGHSSGAFLAVSVLADLCRRGEAANATTALGFLSLGQVVPMMSFLPQAQQLRADLQTLSQDAAVDWVDVSAPGDGCCFALCDPVAVSGQASPKKRGPLVFSAAFTQSLSPARWKALRWRFFRLHFQYLCAFDQPKDYDYFQITAGPIRLVDRYAGRVPSKSRIELSHSKYTSTTP